MTKLEFLLSLAIFHQPVTKTEETFVADGEKSSKFSVCKSLNRVTWANTVADNKLVHLRICAFQ
jgi:hypothetical protein